MANPHGQLKSLKLFNDILISHEAEYRTTAPDSRDLVINQIATEIRESASEKGKQVAEEDILHRVSTYILNKYPASTNQYFWAIANH